MNTPRTPRLRSAYPFTPPRASERSRSKSSSPTKRNGTPVRMIRAESKSLGDPENAPLIPLSTLDAPSQRFYVLAVYFALWAWRLHDWFGIRADDVASLWLFMKWTVLDGVFLYGLPSLRIPWLEPSLVTVTTLFGTHATLTALLMFRVPVPFEAWLMAIGKIFWDKEITISEGTVKAASLIQNASLIMGKQIINILPEGSANLNPENEHFCLGHGKSMIHIPMYINQTVPTSIELLRSDFDTNLQESVVFSAREVKNFKKEADRALPKGDKTSPRTLRLPVKQTGLYRLGRVLDESKLEVQRPHSEALVVQCPSAAMTTGTQHRCKGELSNFTISVDAVPPLKIWYTRTINRGDDTSVSLTWHPEDLESPLLGRSGPGPVVSIGAEHENVSWAQSRRHQISVNETMSASGGWQYYIDKVQDGCGNVVSYGRSEEEKQKRAGKSAHLEQDFIIHERPRIKLSDCSAQKPKRVASGSLATLGIHVSSNGQAKARGTKHHIAYSFSPSQDEMTTGDAPAVRQRRITISPGERGPLISEPGIYSLLSVETDHCSGDVLEPSSCLLVNPPQPDVMVTSEEIAHKCAGNSVGILVHLDLVGSPPFSLHYTEQRRGGSLVHKTERISSLRHQLVFEPKEAGHYTYNFLDVADSIYEKPQSLKSKGFKLEQDIKPTAWARFLGRTAPQSLCLDQSALFDVVLTGEGPPYSLEYDLVHGRSRQKMQMTNLDQPYITLKTPKLSKGGTYSITLSSVTDRSNCKIFLDQEIKVDVRQQRPSAGFGKLEGGRSTRSLKHQKVRLPLRLTGEKPWNIAYSKSGSEEVHHARVESSNDHLEVNEEGTYNLQAVSDVSCPGTIDETSASFTVQWIAQPTIDLSPSHKISGDGSQLAKQAVCEGEQDSFDLLLSGNGPYYVQYDIHEQPEHGTKSVQSRKETYASNGASIRMQTKKSGTYKYSITGVGDQYYSLSKQKSTPIVVQQKVHARPNAVFSNPGKAYSYCKEDDTGNEVVPVTLTGQPPFLLEIGIKHQASSKPEIITISDIPSNRYNIQIPRGSLSLGGYSVDILRVMDGNGCQRVKDRSDRRDLIHVNVVDVPTITPMESKTDYCVGDRIAYSLSGTAPFNIFYTFEGTTRKAAVSNTDFRRLAEKPGVFTINSVSDRASTDACRASYDIKKVIHELPSVRISKGKVYEVDIHEGGETEILFEFGGSPPFEFTYTRSTNAARGKKSVVLETRHDVSHEHTKRVKAFEEGTYEVVAIRDKFCGVSMSGKLVGASGQKLIK